MRQIILSGIFLLGTAMPALAQLTNGGFESGLTGWTLAGNIGRISSSFGKTPTEGARAAYMVSQNTLVNGLTTSAAGGSNSGQVSAATLASALGTTTTALENAAGAGSSVLTGTGATGGSGIFQSFTVAANTTLFFDWDFLTSEDQEFGPGTANPYNNDFGFMVINGQVTPLARVNKLGTDPFETEALQYIPFSNGAVDGSNVQSFLFEVGDGTGTEAVRATDYEANTGTFFGAAKFKRFGISFTSAQTVNLGFGVINAHTSNGSKPSAFLVDNVRIVNGVIPEPGTIALLALGSLGALAIWRRR